MNPSILSLSQLLVNSRVDCELSCLKSPGEGKKSLNSKPEENSSGQSIVRWCTILLAAHLTKKKKKKKSEKEKMF